MKFALTAVPTLDEGCIRVMCADADTKQLIKLRDAFKAKAAQIIPLSPQLKAKKDTTKIDNKEYKF